MGNTLAVEKVDLESGTIEYETTKNGEPFSVHLTDELISILKELPPRNGRIFGYRSKSSARKAMKIATKKAGLPYRKFHELGRHSFATFFAKKNWNPKKIADAGGWETVAMVNEVYTNLEDSGKETRDEFNEIGKKVAKKKKKDKQDAENIK